jgi:hypothetical protein
LAKLVSQNVDNAIMPPQLASPSLAGATQIGLFLLVECGQSWLGLQKTFLLLLNVCRELG